MPTDNKKELETEVYDLVNSICELFVESMGKDKKVAEQALIESGQLIQTYIDTQVEEARVDELEKLTIHFGFLENADPEKLDKYIQKRQSKLNSKGSSDEKS